MNLVIAGLAASSMLLGVHLVSRFVWENWGRNPDHIEALLFKGGLSLGIGVGIFAGGALFSFVR